MGTFGTTSAPAPREAPRVGEYRRGSRLRTTRAGTWFPALGPDDQPAGLLLLHPAVTLRVLRPTIGRLARLGLPGVLPTLPDLVTQAGRNWLVATASPAPTLADLLDKGPHRGPGNAAALLADVAVTLLEVHDAGLAHGGVGPQAVVLGTAGTALLTDWGTDQRASAAGDLRAWCELAGLLAQHWCPGPVARAAVLARAVHAAERLGPADGFEAALDQLQVLAAATPRDELAAAAGRVSAPTRRRAPAPPPEVTEPAEPELALEPVALEPPGREPAACDQPTAPHRPAPPHLVAPHPVAGPLPAPAPQPPGSWARVRPVVLAVALALALLGAAVLVVRAFEPERPKAPGTAPAAPLDIRSVAVQSRRTGSICVVTASVTTNGQPGRVVYRWIGENGSQSVATVSTSAGGYEMEIGLLWSSGSPPLPGSSVTLQILEPRPGTTTETMPLGCN